MELLKKLYCIHSKSNKESDLIEFLLNWLFENVPDAHVELDNVCNVYVTRGMSETYPCIVAHLDQVQTLHSEDFQAVETDDIIFGWSAKNKRYEGLGADDKNGIWVALQCLLRYDNMKAAFFIGEEIGCVGSGKADMTFFEDCRFVVQCDRRGFDDFITEASITELCSNDFATATNYELFNYKETRGLMTDVMTLKQNGLKVSCCNLSCGYYKPHTDEEFTIKYDLLNCRDLVFYIFETCVDVYKHEYEYKPYSSSWNDWYDENGRYKGYGYGYGGYGGYGGYNNQKQIGFKTSVSNTQEKKTCVAQETSPMTADDHKIQKFFDDETGQQEDEYDDLPDYGFDDDIEDDFPLTGEIYDEVYDVIYALLSDCPSASFEMIRSALLPNYPNLTDKDIYTLYGEVKRDIKQYYPIY